MFKNTRRSFFSKFSEIEATFEKIYVESFMPAAKLIALNQDANASSQGASSPSLLTDSVGGRIADINEERKKQILFGLKKSGGR